MNEGLFFFFFNDTATTEIYTLSLHDALPIYRATASEVFNVELEKVSSEKRRYAKVINFGRSEEHTSELQSPCNLVCRLLLEKKKNSTSSQQRSVICESSSHDIRHETCHLPTT